MEMHKNEKQIAESIRNNREVVETAFLTTDQKVIARVTDGIYRQPGSALRELISNAYDADATEVRIRTDEPRFNSMTIEDNGNGMSPETLTRVMNHIGGSSKRNTIGAEYGITDAENFDLSPGGRHLIGKIGIGLFSVSQLTQSFQIITKRKGDAFRSIANVTLKQFSDQILKDENDSNEYESGTYKIWTENASDLESHGTTIILHKIRIQTKETLSSFNIWAGVAASKESPDNDENEIITPPKYHIGSIKDEEHLKLLDDDEKVRSVPWGINDAPDVAFKKLVKCVWDESKPTNPTPKLSTLFDFYLKMVWDLALSIPTGYVEKDIFEIPYENQFYAYKISNVLKAGQATPLELHTGEKLNDHLKFTHENNKTEFNVFIDNLKLSRPIIFENLPSTSHVITKPMIFIGEYWEEFKNLPQSMTGGPLKFKAYLLWNSKICPTEHQGVCIRVHDASGTLFDDTFMKYQVQENTRKRQVTFEIFVEQGLDSALNIDRESYNFSHPHVVILTRWVHSAFRQFSNANKQLAKKLRDNKRGLKQDKLLSKIDSIVEKAWSNAGNDLYQTPPKVAIIDSGKQDSKSINESDYIVDFANITHSSSEKEIVKTQQLSPLSEEKIKAITAILASYGLLESLSFTQRNSMIKAIYEVIVAEGEA
ncbi:TPA: ATP-binding protein [Klebsiella pneumoniae]|uniref:ATP-binding protein n=1 Tax=Klebsiella variicola TaxID=244366 RepID=UPI002180F169|nr:ATP-binding protein [Klebsiella variicola]GKN38593.1 ATP-binding protein [Klebsiella variicola]HCB0389478.1 ATP-binding protein [Klebsiella pneumoniae]HDT0379904.1 ATP-binding protein [Klebsiella variicola]